MDDPIQDRVGDGLFSDDLVTFSNRRPGGDDGRVGVHNLGGNTGTTNIQAVIYFNMESVKDLVKQILGFPLKLRHLNDGASEPKIALFEKTYQLELPSDFKAFLLIANGIVLLESTVFGIVDESIPVSLNGAYKYEHFEVENKMPKYLVPFSPDGKGNHYCFDCSAHENDSCKVVFWEYDVLYDVNDPPEIVNKSFTEWAQQVLIDWKLLDINYDGPIRKG